MRIILVLGSPNSNDGVLSEMAESRVKVCLSLYEKENTCIILTGGYGAHFNVTEKPHAFYLKEALLKNGIPESAILSLVESRHSVEDATESKSIIEEINPEEVLVVTSDYHLQRAKIIFSAVFSQSEVFKFIPASSEKVDSKILRPLLDHEKTAVKDLIENGVRF